MPHYRKLWTKFTTSEDVQAMPDDTTRLAWALLPTALDREGRGIYNGAWLRSRVFPLREDIENAQARAMLDWWREHGMIVAYSVDGRDYFYLPTWTVYQGDCGREALSEIPCPPDTQVVISSRSALEAIVTNSGTQAQAPALAPASAQAPAPAASAEVPAAACSEDAFALLTAYGVGEKNARAVADADPQLIRAWIAELESRENLHNPAGMLFSMVRAGMPPPVRAGPRDGSLNAENARRWGFET